MFKRFFLSTSFLLISLSLVTATSCAPVKFSKSDNVVVDTGTPNKVLSCDAKINDTLVSFTYTNGVALPRISSRCNTTKNVNYEWVVKKADGSLVATMVPGLSGANPTSVDFKPLGVGNYYVFLKATDSTNEYKPYNATNPLEFIVPSQNEPQIPMACVPKVNGGTSPVVIGNNDANPNVTANCNPAASMHLWTVYKNSVQITVPGLTGPDSTPNFKALGVGEYRIYLYATHPSGSHWQTGANPLVVQVTDNGNPPEGSKIECNPRINGSLTNLTITPSSANPLISANCAPASVQYNWTVTRNGQTISIPALSGANSNPPFGSLGEGTYLIYLTASRPNSTSWTSTSPLIITVEGPGNPNLTLNCSPRLNGQYVSLNIKTTDANPVVTSGCNPSTVTHSWSVTKDGVTFSLPGISGPNSTPNFTGSGVGKYLIRLTASAPGYNTYVSPSPLEVNVGNAGPDIRHVTFVKDVTTSGNKVDILLVVDDSNSMLPENTKLAQKLQGFVNDLSASGLDWQMCSTLTRAQVINNISYWGASKNWVGYVGSPLWILKLGAPDPYSIFTNTINQIGAGWAGTDDERAIKAAYWHAEYASYNNCYRQDASLAVIILSDEDERSIGGNKSLQYYWDEFKPLEADDVPQAYVNKIKEKFGEKKNFTVNSIIVKPKDTTCMAAQDADGAKSHYGFLYNELSNLTKGYVGSICDADYSNSLYYFKDKIVNSLSSIELECAPVGKVNVLITPAMGPVTTTIVNNSLVFNPVIPAGRTITVDYDCPAH